MNARDRHLLLRVLRCPETSLAMTPAVWDLLVRQARRAGVLALLGTRLEELGWLGQLPPKIREHFQAARTEVAGCQRVARWEVDRIQRALAGTGVPIVLLKGAAYVLAGLPVAKGRHFSDVDILVPKETLGEVEQALIRHGWAAVKLDPYYQRYYRTWSHELPPLRHRSRGTVVDVHHAILPASGRLRPDARQLLQAARPLGDPRLKVLAPTDMVLHSAVHSFQDGDLHEGLRDLVDLDGLMRHFGAEAGFWEALVSRATRLGLERPLFYAMRYTGRLLETPVPTALPGDGLAGRPSGPILRIMDWLVTRTVVPRHPEERDVAAAVAQRILYARSHWLRMPPLLLARHLLRKSLPRRPHA